MKKDIADRLDAKLPEAIMLDIKRQLRKNTDLATKVDSLEKRMTAMEASLTAIHLHQAQQTDLLQRLMVAQIPSSTQLADNKKGEKETSSKGEKASSIFLFSQGESRNEGEQKVLNIQVSKVIVPTIAFTKPPVLDSIDLIQ